eukprot:COSAG05_NODE_22029_length_267_cov_1.232143_1_plen_75_part_01
MKLHVLLDVTAIRAVNTGHALPKGAATLAPAPRGILELHVTKQISKDQVAGGKTMATQITHALTAAPTVHPTAAV